MPKPYLKTLLLRLGVILSFFITIFFIYSCKKEIGNNNKTSVPLSPAIAQAKSWYETAYPKKNQGKLSVTSIDSATSDLSQLATPDWDYPATYTRFEDDVVEVPIAPESKLAVSLSNSPTGSPAYQNIYSRSSFLLLKKFDKYHAYIMTIIADPVYLKGDLRKLDHNKYNKRDSDFTGVVLYSTPKGEFVNGWFYHEGIITGQISTQNPSTDSETSSGGKTVQNVKTDKLVSVLVCTDWYQTSTVNGKVVDKTFLGTTCVIQQQDDGTTDNILGGSGGGGGSTGGGTGSGSGSSNPTTKPSDCMVSTASTGDSGKTQINSLKVQKVNPADGGSGFPPPTGLPPCPDPLSLTDPCKQKDDVSKKAADAVIAKQNADIAAKISTGKEFGADQKVTAIGSTAYMNTAVRTDASDDSFNPNFTWNSTDGYEIGTSHDHPGGSAPSPDDVFTMIDNLSNSQLGSSGVTGINFYKNNVSITVITSTVNYVVTVNNWGTLQTQFDAYNKDRNAYDQSYLSKVTAYTNANHPTVKSDAGVAALLSLFGNAINIYQAPKGTTAFDPKTLTNSVVSTKPCP